MLKGWVKGQKLDVVQTTVAAETIDWLTMEFEFDAAWEHAAKTAIIYREETEESYAFLLRDDKITEDMHLNLATGKWSITLIGTITTEAGVQRITTVPAHFVVKDNGRSNGAEMPEVAPTYGEQVVALAQAAEEKAQSVVDAAERGEFDGKEGFSPVVTAEEEEDGVRITVENKTGTQTAKVMNGKPGKAPSAKVTREDGGAKIEITDEAGTTTAKIEDGKTPIKDVDYFDGKDGISPTAKVVETAEGAIFTVKDAEGTTEVTIKDGKPGSDAAVTQENIRRALGYDPANAETTPTKEDLSALQNDVGELESTIDAMPIYTGSPAVNRIYRIAEVKDDKVTLRPFMLAINYGFGWSNDNSYMTISCATEEQIKNKLQDFRPVSPHMIDPAVRAGLISNSKITEEDKPSIQQTLGIVTLTQEEYDLISVKGENTIYIIV